MAAGFARDITVGLTRFQELFVFAPGTSFRYPAGTGLRDVARELKVDYLLSGAVAPTSDRFRATVTLTDAKGGRVIWSERFDTALRATDVLGVREAVADRVVQAIAQPYGVMFTEKARELEGKPPESFSSYECVLHFQLYWQRLAAERYEAVRGCLERAVARDPDHAEAVAALAFIHIDAYRFKFDGGVLGERALPRALALHHYMRGAYRDALTEAQKIDMPKIIYPHILRAIAHAQLGNRSESRAEVERIRAIDASYGDRVIADLERRNVHRSIISAAVGGLRKAGMTGTDMTKAVPFPEG